MKKHEITSLADVDALAKRWGVKSDSLSGANTSSLSARAVDINATVSDVSEIASIRSYAAQTIDFTVDGLVAAGTITMISGEPACGKSTFATAMCSAIERGQPFAGLGVQRRPVLILDRENPLPVVTERFNRLGITDGENFKVWGGWAPEEAPDPGSPIVARWIQHCDPKPVILIDSYVAFNGGDENSATETRAFFNQLRSLANGGATIIVLHHSGKAESSKDYRGSSDIKAAIDTGYLLTNCGSSNRLSSLRLKPFKSRFLVEEAVFQYVGGRFEADARPASRTNGEVMRELLVKRPRILGKDFIEEAMNRGVTQNRARSFLEDGLADKSIRVELGKNNSKFYTYASSDTH